MTTPDPDWERRNAELWAAIDDFDPAGFRARIVALVDTGREREAAGLALGALARHLPRYNRSLASYAEALSGR